jgi:8-amino-7-oxononanoate synthase
VKHFYLQLQDLVPYLRKKPCGTEMLQIPRSVPQSPIFSLITPEPRSLARFCQDAAFIVRPIVPPTVPEGTQRVRVCLHAGNSFEDVRRLVAKIKEWLVQKQQQQLEGNSVQILKPMKSAL